MSTQRIKIGMKEPVTPAVAAPRKIFNPLDEIAVASDSEEPRQESLSTIINEAVGICPKCKKTMGTAIIANNDTVFYCDADRVSAPMPNKDGC